MKTRDWCFNCLQLLPAMHFCVTMPQTFVRGIAGSLIDDLKVGVKYAKSNAGTVAQTTALYDLAGSTEGNQQMTELVFGLFDYLYTDTDYQGQYFARYSRLGQRCASWCGSRVTMGGRLRVRFRNSNNCLKSMAPPPNAK